MKLFLLTLVVFLGLGNTLQANFTDHIPSAVKDAAHTCAEIYRGFKRDQAALHEEPQQFGIPAIDAAGKLLDTAIDFIELPLIFLTYALAVGLLRFNGETVEKSIKLFNGE